MADTPKEPDPLQQTKSYASIVSQVKGIQNIQFGRRNAVIKHGLVTVAFNEEEIARSLEPLKYSLVAKFFSSRPSVDVIRNFIQRNWDLHGSIFVGVLDPKHLILRFESRDDYLKTWLEDNFTIRGSSFSVFPWSPYFVPNQESSRVPVWVSLPLLPFNLFHIDILASIVSGLGTLLTVDNATLNKSRPSMARVCIAIDVLKPLHHSILIEMGQRKIVQKVVYENLPLFCSKCYCKGHTIKYCMAMDAKKKEQSQKEKGKEIDVEAIQVGENGDMNTIGVKVQASLVNDQIRNDSAENKNVADEVFEEISKKGKEDVVQNMEGIKGKENAYEVFEKMSQVAEEKAHEQICKNNGTDWVLYKEKQEESKANIQESRDGDQDQLNETNSYHSGQASESNSFTVLNGKEESVEEIESSEAEESNHVNEFVTGSETVEGQRDENGKKMDLTKKQETLPEKMARKRTRLRKLRLSYVKKPKRAMRQVA